MKNFFGLSYRFIRFNTRSFFTTPEWVTIAKRQYIKGKV
jgi:hypothetical protein